MAHLPPKVPNMTIQWPDFPHQRLPALENLEPNTTPTTTTQNPSWFDEFLDYSSSKCGSHRRSISDSIAFLELLPTVAEECPKPPSQLPLGAATRTEFDRFDDEQFVSMFTDEIAEAVGPTVSSSNPSSPSDHNSINDDHKLLTPWEHQQLKNESEEVQSSCKLDGKGTNSHAMIEDSKIIDPKRVKRILANRQSAQRSRVRKLQYVSELERSVSSLQAEVSVLSPRVAFLDHQRLVLNVDNNVLKQRIAALAQDKLFKDAHQEAMKREIERLRQAYYQLNLEKIENDANSDANGSKENEPLLN